MQLNWIDVGLILALSYCVFTDVKYRKIKNYITFPLMFMGIIYNSYLNGVHGAVFSLKGLLICGLLSIILFAFKGFGMGDVKLFMGIGAIKGFNFTLETMIFSFFAAVIISLIIKPKATANAVRNIYYIFKGVLYRSYYNITPEQSALTVPYAAYAMCGLILAYIVGGDWIWGLLTR